jgi:hypothetical protein
MDADAARPARATGARAESRDPSLPTRVWQRAVERAPWLGWIARWGLSLWSLGLGCLVLFVFRRGLPHVGWIIGYLLLLWLLWMLVAMGRARRQGRGTGLVLGAAEYAIQTLYHNLLLFVLPAYYAAATLASPNALFVAGVAGAALLTAVDPWYRRLVHPWPWINHALFGFAIFAALNVALPLVRIQPILALHASAVLAVLALTPEIRRRGALSWRWAGALAAGGAVVAALLVWQGRALVPPAPLFLSRAVLARDVAELEPVDAVPGARIAAGTVAAWGGLTAFTAVYAPSGLWQPVEHVWTKDGVPIARVALAPVRGGRPGGFRTWSRRRDLRPPFEGRYTVDVVTASGQLIGRLAFTVTP